jgi:flagellin-like protein
MDKKALSPVIATILLIALVLVLALIIFLWARGFVSEQIQKFGQPIEDLCSQADFDVELIEGSLGKELEIVNRGNAPIHSFDIKEIKGGDSEIQKFRFSVDVGAAIRQPISIDYSTEEIVIYPALLGNVKGKTLNKIFTCLGQGKTIKL